MHSRFLLALLALAGAITLAGAQDLAATNQPKPAAAATTDDATRPTPGAHATPVPTPTPKPGLMKRLFGGKPTPKPTPTPATPRARRIVHRPPPADDDDRKKDDKKPGPEAKPAPAKPESTPPAPEKPADSEAKPDDTASPEKTEKPEKPGPTDVPAPDVRKPVGKRGKGHAPAATPSAKSTSREQEAVARATAGGDPDAIEKAKYDEVKSRAAADTHVLELRDKADSATTEEDGRKALRAYNQALFQKMRHLDSTLEPRIDRMEKAVLHQLEKKD